MSSRVPLTTLLLSAVALLLASLPGADGLLEFERHAVAGGEIWRLVTGHLTHFGWNHLVWDLAVFLGLGAYVERIDRRRFQVALLASALSIGLGVLFFQPQFATYRGLSGVDSALFALTCAHFLQFAREHHDKRLAAIGLVALAGFIAKSGYEFLTGATVFTDAAAAGFEPVPLAHVIGAVTGVAVALLPGLSRRTRAGQVEGLRG